MSKNTENDFYKKLWNCAARDMEALGKDAGSLQPEEVPLWWHDHCEFCWEKIEADKDMTCYCTEDHHHWVCEECYNDFKDMLEAEE